MGSLQRNGNPITQARNTVRQLGGAFTESADRAESRTVVHNSGIFGPQLNVHTAQTSTQRAYEGVKITRSTDDTTVRFVAVSGLADL